VGGATGREMKSTEICTGDMITFALEPPPAVHSCQYEFSAPILEIKWSAGDSLNSSFALQYSCKDKSKFVYFGNEPKYTLCFVTEQIDPNSEIHINVYSYLPGSEENKEDWSEPFSLTIPPAMDASKYLLN
jgi:hypothetical protein